MSAEELHEQMQQLQQEGEHNLRERERKQQFMEVKKELQIDAPDALPRESERRKSKHRSLPVSAGKQITRKSSSKNRHLSTVLPQQNVTSGSPVPDLRKRALNQSKSSSSLVPSPKSSKSSSYISQSLSEPIVSSTASPSATQITKSDLETLIGRDPKYPRTLDLSLPTYNIDSAEFLYACPNVLKELNLAHNSLKNCTQLCQFSKLKILRLDHNQISDISFDGLATVKQVDLSYNELEFLSDMSALEKLEELNLSNNRITAGWGELRKLKQLKVLDVSHNNINLKLKHFTNFIWRHIKQLTKLQSVKFEGNGVMDSIYDFKYFVISELPTLQYFNNNKISNKDREYAQRMESSGHWEVSQSRIVRNQVTPSRFLPENVKNPKSRVATHLNVGGDAPEEEAPEEPEAPTPKEEETKTLPAVTVSEETEPPNLNVGSPPKYKSSPNLRSELSPTGSERKKRHHHRKDRRRKPQSEIHNLPPPTEALEAFERLKEEARQKKQKEKQEEEERQRQREEEEKRKEEEEEEQRRKEAAEQQQRLAREKEMARQQEILRQQELAKQQQQDQFLHQQELQRQRQEEVRRFQEEENRKRRLQEEQEILRQKEELRKQQDLMRQQEEALKRQEQELMQQEILRQQQQELYRKSQHLEMLRQKQEEEDRLRQQQQYLYPQDLGFAQGTSQYTYPQDPTPVSPNYYNQQPQQNAYGYPQLSPRSNMHTQSQPHSSMHIQSSPHASMPIQSSPHASMPIQSSMHLQSSPHASMHVQSYQHQSMFYPQTSPNRLYNQQQQQPNAYSYAQQPPTNLHTQSSAHASMPVMSPRQTNDMFFSSQQRTTQNNQVDTQKYLTARQLCAPLVDEEEEMIGTRVTRLGTYIIFRDIWKQIASFVSLTSVIDVMNPQTLSANAPVIAKSVTQLVSGVQAMCLNIESFLSVYPENKIAITNSVEPIKVALRTIISGTKQITLHSHDINSASELLSGVSELVHTTYELIHKCKPPMIPTDEQFSDQVQKCGEMTMKVLRIARGGELGELRSIAHEYRNAVVVLEQQETVRRLIEQSVAMGIKSSAVVNSALLLSANAQKYAQNSQDTTAYEGMRTAALSCARDLKGLREDLKQEESATTSTNIKALSAYDQKLMFHSACTLLKDHCVNTKNNFRSVVSQKNEKRVALVLVNIQRICKTMLGIAKLADSKQYDQIQEMVDIILTVAVDINNLVFVQIDMPLLSIDSSKLSEYNVYRQTLLFYNSLASLTVSSHFLRLSPNQYLHLSTCVRAIAFCLVKVTNIYFDNLVAQQL